MIPTSLSRSFRESRKSSAPVSNLVHNVFKKRTRSRDISREYTYYSSRDFRYLTSEICVPECRAKGRPYNKANSPGATLSWRFLNFSFLHFISPPFHHFCCARHETEWNANSRKDSPRW